MRHGELEVEVLIEAAGVVSQDAAAVFPTADGLLIVVADGAGGTSGGARASEIVVAACARAAVDGAVRDLVGVLHSINAELRADPAAGETTAVLALVSRDEISGASVGDSEAWLVSGDRVTVLTEHQKRKPLLGTRRAMPIPFFARLGAQDSLLLGTDGLFKYVSREPLLEALSGAGGGELAGIRSQLSLPGGALQDDVAMILCRRAPYAAWVQSNPST